MCARFFIRPAVHEILAWLDATPDDDLSDEVAPRWNVAPTQQILGAWQDPVTGTRRLGRFRWGLVPSWWKTAKLPTWVNARSESAADKPAFRSGLRQRRLLVPAAGFYEWTTDGKAKLPHAVTLPDGAPMALAGIYETWLGGGEPLRSLTILTCDPCPAVAPLHDRMPVIVPPDAWGAWLDPSARPDAVKALLAPWDGPLDVRAVGRGVNNVRHTDGSWFDEGV